jgi:hypothetical protein
LNGFVIGLSGERWRFEAEWVLPDHKPVHFLRHNLSTVPVTTRGDATAAASLAYDRKNPAAF